MFLPTDILFLAKSIVIVLMVADIPSSEKLRLGGEKLAELLIKAKEAGKIAAIGFNLIPAMLRPFIGMTFDMLAPEDKIKAVSQSIIHAMYQKLVAASNINILGFNVFKFLGINLGKQEKAARKQVAAAAAQAIINTAGVDEGIAEWGAEIVAKQDDIRFEAVKAIEDPEKREEKLVELTAKFEARAKETPATIKPSDFTSHEEYVKAYLEANK